MAKMAPIQPTLAFGSFSGRWAWRVEWADKKGRQWYQDFPQRDLHPGEAKQQADAYAASLKADALAA
jgi:hypothetical protein